MHLTGTWVIRTEEADNNPADGHGTRATGVEAIAEEPATSQCFSEGRFSAKSIRCLTGDGALYLVVSAAAR